MRRVFVPILLLAACVVRSGTGTGGLSPAEPQPLPADFVEVEARLDVLLDNPVDVDQRDRLQGARSLARHMKTAPPEVQQDVLRYLSVLVAIEERARPIELPPPDSEDKLSAFSPLVSPVLEEEIEEVDHAPPGAPPPSTEAVPPKTPEISGTDAIVAARASLDANQPAAALGVLEPCRDQACWSDAEPLWVEARDAYVGEERDRAGALWLEAGRESDPARRAEVLREIRAILAALVDRFPDTVHAADIRRNIEQVQGELGALEAGGGPEDEPVTVSPDDASSTQGP